MALAGCPTLTNVNSSFILALAANPQNALAKFAHHCMEDDGGSFNIGIYS